MEESKESEFESLKMKLLDLNCQFNEKLLNSEKVSDLPTILQEWGTSFIKQSKLEFSFILQPLMMPQDEDEIDLSMNSQNFSL